MRFVKLRLKNFKPYYDIPNKHQEILFYDKERKEKNITLNIGPTGHGKTSISEAIMWCLYGNLYCSEWGNWVNSLSIGIGKESKRKEVGMVVELVLDVDGTTYRVVRSGSFDVANDEVSETDLAILRDGEMIGDDPRAFVADHFPTVALMEYFVFDGDDILKKFEEDRSRTIRDHINKIVGVERLDNIISSLRRALEIYDERISEVESEMSDETAQRLKDQENDAKKKREAISRVDQEIKRLERQKRKLFKGSLPPEVKTFSELVDKRDRLREDIRELNREFLESPLSIVPNFDLILLNRIVREAIERLSQKETTREEFETSLEIVKSVMGRDYCGVIFHDEKGTRLIPNGVEISDDNLGNPKSLALSSGKGTKAIAARAFKDVIDRIDEMKEEFVSLMRDLGKKKKRLTETEYQIYQVGETASSMDLKRKYDEFKALEKQIEEQRDLRSRISEQLSETEKEITVLRSKLQLDEDRKRRIKRIQQKKHFSKNLLEAARATRSRFLDELLAFVNRESSKIFRSIVRDTRRFHSIEIDSDYQFKVKQESGEPLENDQINRGNLQIAMMSFFIGLAKFLKKQIPYVIDDPLLRLDLGHDRRLIKELCKSNEQLILHMIPGKEYNSDTYRWLGPHVNTQNWIHRRDYKNLGNVSYVQNMDPDKMVKFDIEDL